MANLVVTKMAEIQALFMELQRYPYTPGEFDNLINSLNSKPVEFRSVGYESASMSIGLADFEHQTLDNWLTFQKLSLQHEHHVSVGLGWALAKLNVNPRRYPHLEVMLWMILDGMGYYFALYQARRTVKQAIIPDVVETDQIRAFDQGVGRRLWYIAQGDPTEACDLVNNFSAERRNDLWRGLGIACGYVGGSDPGRLTKLRLLAGSSLVPMVTGVAMAAHARAVSRSLTPDIELALSILADTTVDELDAKTGNLYSNSPQTSSNFYINLIKQIEDHFA